MLEAKRFVTSGIRFRELRLEGFLQDRLAVCFVGFGLLAMVGCGVPSEAPTADEEAPAGRETGPTQPGPIGGEAYDARLTEQIGLPFSGLELAAQASRAMESWESRLKAEAEGMGSAPWRDLLEPALRSHPPDPPAVLEAYRREIERSFAFVQRLDLVTLPHDGPAGVQVDEIRNPIFQRYFSLAMYLDGRLAVTVRPADGEAGAAADYLRNHCNVCIAPLAVHEVFPGHHLAYRRAEAAEPDEATRRVLNRRHAVYHEGWALYAEELMLDHGYYDAGEATLGALRLLYLRALRAYVDPELHGGRLSPEAAESLYVTRALLTPAAARSEVDRHLKDPGLKATYFVGARLIHSARERWSATNPEAGLREFHNRFLGLPGPLPQVARERLGLELEGRDLLAPPERASLGPSTK